MRSRSAGTPELEGVPGAGGPVALPGAANVRATGYGRGAVGVKRGETHRGHVRPRGVAARTALGPGGERGSKPAPTACDLVRPRGAHSPRWPERVVRATGLDVGSALSSPPTRPSPHDRDTCFSLEETGQSTSWGLRRSAAPRFAGPSARRRGRWPSPGVPGPPSHESAIRWRLRWLRRPSRRGAGCAARDCASPLRRIGANDRRSGC